MKKFTKSILLIITMVLMGHSSFSQCSPDPNCTDPEGDGEFCPTEFPLAVEDVYYDQTLTVIAPVEQQGIQLHHIDILDIGNIPPGMNYQCQNNDCSFYPAVPKCVSVYGTPEIGSWGTYTLYLSIEIFMDVAGIPISLGVIEDSSAYVIIQPQIYADFSIDYDFENILCSYWDYELTYTGNATSEAIYTWNFGESIEVLSGEGQGPYLIRSTEYIGLDSISLVVEEGPYTSPEFTEIFSVDICEGLADNNQLHYTSQPNPFNDHILIEGLGNKTSSIEVYDLMGRNIKSFISNESSIRLDLWDLQKGIYLLSVTNGEDTKTQKIVKQ